VFTNCTLFIVDRNFHYLILLQNQNQAAVAVKAMYVGYPESKFRWVINKKTRIYYKPCILPFDVHTVHYFST